MKAISMLCSFKHIMMSQFQHTFFVPMHISQLPSENFLEKREPAYFAGEVY